MSLVKYKSVNIGQTGLDYMDSAWIDVENGLIYDSKMSWNGT